MKVRSLFILGLLGLAACSSVDPISGLPELRQALSANPVNLVDVPFFPQEDYQCGPAALATVLANSGVEVTDQELVDHVYIPARRGSLQLEMLAATRRFQRIPYEIEPTLGGLLKEVAAGRPVVVFQNLGLSWLPQWHYAVAVGFDVDSGDILLRSGTIRDYRIPLRVFERTWRRTGYWGFVALVPGELPVDPDPSRYLASVVAFENTGDSDAIVKAYTAATAAWSDQPVFPAALGNYYYSQGDLSMARDTFSRLVEKFPDFADGHNNLAHVAWLQGDVQTARTHAMRAIELGGPRLATYRSTLESIETPPDQVESPQPLN